MTFAEFHGFQPVQHEMSTEPSVRVGLRAGTSRCKRGVLCTIPALHASRLRPSPPAKRAELGKFRGASASDVPVCWRMARAKRGRPCPTAIRGATVLGAGGDAHGRADIAALAGGVSGCCNAWGGAWARCARPRMLVQDFRQFHACEKRAWCPVPMAFDGPKTWDGLREP